MVSVFVKNIYLICGRMSNPTGFPQIAPSDIVDIAVGGGGGGFQAMNRTHFRSYTIVCVSSSQ